MAIRLAAKGYQVDVFEASDRLGGKLNELRMEGFRFDAGPSLFTLPGSVDELFALCGEDPRQHFHYQKLEVVCQYFYDDGTRLSAFQAPERFAAELERALGEPRANVLKFLRHSQELFELTSELFIFSSVHKLSSFMSKNALKAGMHFGKIDAFKTMDEANRKFFSKPKTVQLFNRYATYNGSNPFKAPGTLNVIPHLEHNVGGFFPRGGMYDITRVLVALAERQGVRFHASTPVRQIRTQGQRVAGVRLDDRFVPADLVVSDVDIVPTYQMLEGHSLPQQFLKQERSTSALIFYWGVNRQFPELELHNILFSNNYEREFEALFDDKKLYHDPTVYIFISAKLVPADAPEGCENWFTMINVPENVGQDWDSIIRNARLYILRKIKKALGVDLTGHIVAEDILDPRLIEKRTSSYHGSLYGPSSNSKFSAFNRHANFKSDLAGMYFTGGSVHPGGGIPLCLSSAKIVASLVDPPGRQG